MKTYVHLSFLILRMRNVLDKFLEKIEIFFIQ